MQKMADDPNLSSAAENIGRAASSLPEMLNKIWLELEAINIKLTMIIGDEGISDVIISKLNTHNELLSEAIIQLRAIEAGQDPIGRPPMTPLDVQAMMDLQGGKEDAWPPDNSRE
jgi:hypothetical protein